MQLCILQGEALQNRQIETIELRIYTKKLFDSARNKIELMTCSSILYAVKLTFSLVKKFCIFILLTH
jgi:hypothetical protein